MNQKDYKAIVEIIIEESQIPKGYETEWLHKTAFVLKLTDYFEREDEKYIEQFKGQKPPKGFNREQFLKDCGVKQ